MKENFENDPFDEFEFKPLTEGLGFHKKPPTTASGAGNSADYGLNDFNLRTDFVEQQPEIPSVQEILRNLEREKIVKAEYQKQLDAQAAAPIAQTETAAVTTAPATPSLLAFIVDSMLVVSIFLSYLLVVVLTTSTDLSLLITQSHPREFLLISYLLLAVVALSYLTLSRLYWRRTAGEWVVEQSVLPSAKMSEGSRAARCLLRSFVVVITGFILFPILSVITRKDLLGLLTDVELRKKRDPYGSRA